MSERVFDPLRQAMQQGESADAWFQRATAESASDGQRDAALDLLTDFVEAVDQSDARSWGGPVPLVYAQFLAGAFRRILKGDRADDALHTRNTKRGKPKGGARAIRREREGFRQNLDAIAAVFYLVAPSCKSITQAEQLVSTIIGASIDRKTIYSARKASGLNPNDTDVLKHCAKKYAARLAAHIPPITAADCQR